MSNITFQYVRRRKYIGCGGNPFKIKWVEKDGIFQPAVMNRFIYYGSVLDRVFELYKYNDSNSPLNPEGTAYLIELDSEYARRYGKVNYNHGACNAQHLRLESGEKPTKEYLKLIVEMYNLTN